MNIKSKLTGVITLFLTLAFLAGCTATDGIKLSKALVKSVDMKSAETSTEMSLNLNFEGYDLDESQKQTIELLNNSTINAVTKSDLENNVSATNATIGLSGFGLKAGMYSQDGKTWLKLPTESKYIEVDPSDLASEDASFASSLNMQKELRPLAVKFLKDFIGEVKHDFKDLKSIGTKTVTTPEGDKEVEVIRLSMCDSCVQNFTKSLVDTASESNALKEYLKGVILLAAKTESEGLEDYDPELITSEIDDVFNELKENKDVNSQAVVKALSDYFEVGPQRLVFEFGIDKDGNIVTTDSNLNFIIKNPKDKSKRINVKLDSKSTVYNINKTKVELPSITKNNSIKLKQYVKNNSTLKSSALGEALGVDTKRVRLQIGSTNAFMNDDYTPLDAEPYIEGESTLVPVRFVGEAIGASIDWNDEERVVTYQDDEKTILMKIGETEALIEHEDGGMESINMPVAPVIKNGRTMVPVRFVSEQFGAKVTWDEETQGIVIEKE